MSSSKRKATAGSYTNAHEMANSLQARQDALAIFAGDLVRRGQTEAADRLAGATVESAKVAFLGAIACDSFKIVQRLESLPIITKEVKDIAVASLKTISAAAAAASSDKKKEKEKKKDKEPEPKKRKIDSEATDDGGDKAASEGEEDEAPKAKPKAKATPKYKDPAVCKHDKLDGGLLESKPPKMLCRGCNTNVLVKKVGDDWKRMTPTEIKKASEDVEKKQTAADKLVAMAKAKKAAAAVRPTTDDDDETTVPIPEKDVPSPSPSPSPTRTKAPKRDIPSPTPTQQDEDEEPKSAKELLF